MGFYKCKNCGYDGDELIFQLTDYTYCIASNNEEPEYIDDCDWVIKGNAVIGEPVGCPNCHAWGVDNFDSNND